EPPAAEGGYLRDLTTGVDTRLGGAETGGATVVRPVAITPSASHALVHGGYGDLYLIDIENSTTVRADTNADGAPADKGVVAKGAAVSADGRYVVFLSEATNLVADPPEPFIEHVYLKDLETGDVVRVSSNAATGEEGTGNSRHPVITGDARFVLFPSYAQNLTPLVQK
ncbi:MAG TPA: hypothetical protein VFD39_11600, partial [Trueperaceae bacterium]|nr:hypothetical protein [Trueperaceae bacterium]